MRFWYFNKDIIAANDFNILKRYVINVYSRKEWDEFSKNIIELNPINKIEVAPNKFVYLQGLNIKEASLVYAGE